MYEMKGLQTWMQKEKGCNMIQHKITKDFLSKRINIDQLCINLDSLMSLGKRNLRFNPRVVHEFIVNSNS